MAEPGNDAVQEYIKSHKICELMEGTVSQLLLCQPDDPVLGIIHHLCTTNGLKPPKECPNLKAKVVSEKPQAKDKGKDKLEKERERENMREEQLNRINAEHKKAETRKKAEMDDGADFAAAF
eukprot:TRINITY_DN9156_c4_g1_i1.p3 TRINITY_DN9156_c4_g1~~TRINITY_DN9156_c4_g1_i1.p3  ORF type:complete len:122 (+),score=48.66 TRINITY_DN9156_c4_g1_i1:234-599(+)